MAQHRTATKTTRSPAGRLPGRKPVCFAKIGKPACGKAAESAVLTTIYVEVTCEACWKSPTMRKG